MANYNFILTKDFIYTSNSKVFVEHNCIENDEKQLSIGIIFLPPNPEWEGSENNKIFNELFYTLKNDFSIIKCVFQKHKIDNFNNMYKNNYKNYKNLLYVRDASVVVDFFFQKFHNIHKCFIVGYSWGCQIAMNIIMRRPELTSFILISPTLSLADCDYRGFIISNFKTNGMIVYGKNDSLSSKNYIDSYKQFLNSKKINVNIESIDTNHYYNTNNAIDDLRKVILNFINNN
ncbi:hypothetical protein AB836_01210 [Rickettsiales bacterium (ex Bugula neritina AB1)]|nr:hypothetical protein AB836_01210 [Rickettsiales bacterium (ex Bugula neritina AB1)]